MIPYRGPRQVVLPRGPATSACPGRGGQWSPLHLLLSHVEVPSVLLSQSCSGLSPPSHPSPRLSVHLGKQGTWTGTERDWVSSRGREIMVKRKVIGTFLRLLGCWLGASQWKGPLAYPQTPTCGCLTCKPPPQPELWEIQALGMVGLSLRVCAAGCGPGSVWAAGWAPGCCPLLMASPPVSAQCAPSDSIPRRFPLPGLRFRVPEPGTWAHLAASIGLGCSLVALADSPLTLGHLTTS